MVMSGMTNVAKPRSSDAKFNILASFGVAAFFRVPLKTQVDYENFAKGIERGTYEVWSKLTHKQCKVILKTCHDAWNALLNSQPSEFSSLVRTSDNDGRTSPSNLNSPSNAARFWEGIHHLLLMMELILMLRDFFQRMDSLARQGASLSDVSTYGVEKAIMVENKQSSEVLLDDPIVKNFDVHDKPSSYVSATGGSKTKQMKLKANFHPLSSDNLCEGANVSIPRKIVKTVSSRLANTLYGYFIGFFFFQFKTPKGLEDVLENGPWMIRKSPIILKKWNMNTRLCKDELARILVWVKIHDVPIQAFTEDGLSIIASKIGKPIMLDSYTSSMCIKSWGRSSFARCLIEINAEDVLLDSLTIGIPCEDDGFSIETISIEYEWKPPRCDLCKIFGYSHDYYPKKVLIPIVDTSKVITPNVVNTSTIPTPSVEKTNDGFQTVGKKKKKKAKSKSNNGGQFVGPSTKQNVRYEPKASTSAPKK
ncbi:zinc knuckle CX2CX4HX4C containing protein, partial [Tanacetum coccineum]